jgi:hypothetical protein
VPNADYVVPIEIDGQAHHVYVLKRPFVDDFLKAMAPLYEVSACMSSPCVLALSGTRERGGTSMVFSVPMFSHSPCSVRARVKSSPLLPRPTARVHHFRFAILTLCGPPTFPNIVQVVLFTASLSKYADPVTDLLDPEGVCRYRLFREHCVFHRGTYVKVCALPPASPRLTPLLRLSWPTRPDNYRETALIVPTNHALTNAAVRVRACRT